MNKFLGFLFLLLAFSACKYNDTIDTVVVDNEFSMEVPSYLKVDDEVKPGAPFGYANRFRNIYTTVFFEDKS